eukprot:CAMPEP_0171208156 /NCGR_PEP_ID=MMETSP0790-20130122/27945_1 /TAXON_ID=2925 /ORGANISM="Alexandrium catenella, Strain OF101" /LENGTH=31 /DNA_ID= /DNA_START= /DNA_END= /DNA_ORIENTATION=
MPPPASCMNSFKQDVDRRVPPGSHNALRLLK